MARVSKGIQYPEAVGFEVLHVNEVRTCSYEPVTHDPFGIRTAQQVLESTWRAHGYGHPADVNATDGRIANGKRLCAVGLEGQDRDLEAGGQEGPRKALGVGGLGADVGGPVGAEEADGGGESHG